MVDGRADDVDAYITFAASKSLRLTHVIDTHVHADHRSGGPELARRTGAQYCMHESADVTFPFTALRDADEIELGNTRVRVLHTPGHSPDSVCLVVTDLKRGADPWFVLTHSPKMLAHTFRGSSLRSALGLEDERKAFARYKAIRKAEREYV